MKLVMRCAPAMTRWYELTRSLSWSRNMARSDSWRTHWSYSHTYRRWPSYCSKSWDSALAWSRMWWPEDEPPDVEFPLDFDGPDE
jgi:hypothetical protein